MFGAWRERVENMRNNFRLSTLSIECEHAVMCTTEGAVSMLLAVAVGEHRLILGCGERERAWKEEFKLT